MNLSQITLKPLSNSQKQKIIDDSGIKSILQSISSSNLQSQEIDLFFINLSNMINNYIKEYDIAWLNFNKSFKITIQSGNFQGNERKAKTFIRVLEKGIFLLEYIRETITGQKINTVFIGKDSSGQVVEIDKRNTSYKLALSTWSVGGNNFVNLAYTNVIQKQIKDLQKDIEENYSVQDIYERIWEVKSQYLAIKKEKTGKDYQRYFDWVDAEIIKRYRNKDRKVSLSRSLTTRHYDKLRKEIHRDKVTAVQSGDSGLDQVKKITFNTKNQINFARQSLIRGHFDKMQQALKLSRSDLVKVLKELFTFDSQIVRDKASQIANKEAIQKFDFLIDILSKI